MINTGTTNGRGKMPPWLVVTIIFLVMVIIVSGVFTYLHLQTSNPQLHAGKPAINTPTANLTTMSAAQLYTYITHKKPHLIDPLDGNQAENWDSGPGCQFKQQAFHLTTSVSQPSSLCFLRNVFVRDFAFQVQVQFGATTLGETQGYGIFFRTHLVQQEGYEFFMYTSSDILVNQPLYGASLTIIRSIPQQLKSWENGDIPSQIHSFNTVTVVALHHQINLYLNTQFQATITDSTFQGGQLGFVGSSTYSNPLFTGAFEAIFRNMKLWTL